jgi:cullin 1
MLWDVRLSHQELVGEVIHQVQNFAPESKLIRQRVEGLIERERAPLSQALVECSSFLAFAQVLKKR